MQYYRYQINECRDIPSIDQIHNMGTLDDASSGFIQTLAIVFFTIIISECLCLFLIHIISHITLRNSFYEIFPLELSVVMADTSEEGELEQEGDKNQNLPVVDERVLDQALITNKWIEICGNENCAICLCDYGELLLAYLLVMIHRMPKIWKLMSFFCRSSCSCTVKHNNAISNKLSKNSEFRNCPNWTPTGRYVTSPHSTAVNDSVSKSKFCKHEFHTSCYKQWLAGRHKKTCPYCRCNVFDSASMTSNISQDPPRHYNDEDAVHGDENLTTRSRNPWSFFDIYS